MPLAQECLLNSTSIRFIPRHFPFIFYFTASARLWPNYGQQGLIFCCYEEEQISKEENLMHLEIRGIPLTPCVYIEYMCNKVRQEDMCVYSYIHILVMLLEL